MTESSTTQPTRVWREDLQGLRVVAILLVAAYHVWSNRISGGVDVFLMLSGFFVGGSLWRRFVVDRPPRAGEYLARQGRRLLPTAITVLAGTAVAFVLIVPSIRWSEGARETLASLLYFENWYLASVGQEYGAADASTSPWQQFWSMSVQGQFFILTPLLLAVVWVLVRRHADAVRKSAMLWTVVGVTLASFAYAVWMARVDQPVAYYDTFARVWEFLLGLLLAVLVAKWTPKGTYWQVVSWIALLALFLTGALIDGITTFPGPLTLIPIGAAALLVIAGAAPHRFGANRILELKWVAECGKYAYAFYLWHWPILVFVTIIRGQASGWRTGGLILLTAAILAVATYHLIEKPLREGSLRHATPQRRIAGISVAALALGIVFAPAGWFGYIAAQQAQSDAAGDSFSTHPGALAITDPAVFGHVLPADPVPSVELVRSDLSLVATDGCVTSLKDRAITKCSYVDGDGLRVAIFGGSHSEQWFEVALDLAEKYNWTLVPFLKQACQPTMPEDGSSEECREWLTRSYDELAAGDFDLVITTATRAGGGADEVPDTYRAMLEELTSHSTVLGIRDNPSFPVDMPECYASGDDCEFALYSRIYWDNPIKALDLQRFATVDANDLICPDQLCRPVVGNRLVFRDPGHLTTSYVKSLSVAVGERWVQALSGAGLDVSAPHS